MKAKTATIKFNKKFALDIFNKEIDGNIVSSNPNIHIAVVRIDDKGVFCKFASKEDENSKMLYGERYFKDNELCVEVPEYLLCKDGEILVCPRKHIIFTNRIEDGFDFYCGYTVFDYKENKFIDDTDNIAPHSFNIKRASKNESNKFNEALLKTSNRCN